MKKIIWALVFILIAAGSCRAQNNDEVMLKAQNGDAKAQYTLWRMYEAGANGLEPDMQEALKWLALSAEQDYAFALYYLAGFYLRGEFFERDYDKAFELLTRALEANRKLDASASSALNTLAKMDLEELFYNGKPLRVMDDLRQRAGNGDVTAQFELGMVYNWGQETKQDFDESIKWYTLAAEQGHADAQMLLGMLYAKLGEQDKAFAWYTSAALNNHKEAMYNIASEYGDKNSKYYDFPKAVEWYLKIAAAGNPDILSHALGWYYERGIGMDADKAEALKWYLKAFEMGDGDAALNIIRLYKEGVDGPKTAAEIMQWQLKYAEFVEAGLPQHLGYAYEKGSAGYAKVRDELAFANAKDFPAIHHALNNEKYEQNYAEAAKWYAIGSDNGNAKSSYALGRLYSEGLGVGQDYARAAELYKKAMEQKITNVELNFDLARLYQNGLGVEQDLVKAYVLLAKAFVNSNRYFPTPYKYQVILKTELTPLMTPAQVDAAQEILQAAGIAPERYL